MKMSRVCLLLALVCLTSACQTNCKGGEEPRFKNLEQAVESGFVAPLIVEQVKAGKPAPAFLLYEPPDTTLKFEPGVRVEFLQGQLRDRYRDEIKRKKAQFKEHFREIKIEHDYAELPIQRTQLYRLKDLEDLMNWRGLTGIAAPLEHDLYLGESIALVRASTSTTWGQRGGGVGVATLDSGLDYSMSPTFSGCTTAGSSGCPVIYATDIAPDDGMLDDVTGHGTMIAEIIRTVANGSRILSFDISRTPGKVNDDDAIEAISEIIDKRFTHNIHVINMSFGTPSSWTVACLGGNWPTGRNPYAQAFPYLRSLGILPVVAAGNNAFVKNVPTDTPFFRSGIAWPACTADALSVSAVYDAANAGTSLPSGYMCTDTTVAADAVPCFAQTGPTLKMFAPGSTVIVGATPRDGTSPAAAFVSGGAAVIFGFRSSETSANDVEAALIGNGATVTDTRNSVTKMRLDVPMALITRAWPQDNDNRANALQLTGSTPAPPRVNWVATAETNEQSHATQAPGASLWYTWTAPIAATFTVTTSGSDFDTVLAVYRVVAGQLFSAGSNDNETPALRTSRVSFPAAAGEQYFFAVDGNRASPTIPPQRGIVRIAVSDRPSNDDLANAMSLTIGSAALPWHNLGATKQGGEPDHCGNDGGASVWFKVRNTGASSSVTVSTTTTTGFSNRCVAVYDMGGPGGTLRYVAGGLWATPDDIYNATFTATPNTDFLIAVDGMSSEQAPFDAPARGQFNVRVQ